MQVNNSVWRSVFYISALFILIIVFASYFAPDMMVALTNQVWAMCGW